MATATRPHPHRESAMPPIVLGLVLLAALVAAAIPLAIVVAAVRYGTERGVIAVLAVVAVFFMLFPLAVRFLTPRERSSRGERR